MNRIQLKLLCLGAQPERLSDSIPDDLYAIDVADNVDCAQQKIGQSTYHAIIIDDALFADEIYIVILQLKQLNPSVPLLVLTNNESLVYQQNLLEVGADDILPKDVSADFLQQRLILCIKRCEIGQETSKRNHRLYEVAQLTRSLHANLDTTTLLEDAAERICDIFALYGIAIIIHSNGILRVYSASADQIKERHLLQSLRDANTDDLFARVIKTGITEVFDDITVDNYYIPLPHLAQARSAIVLPLCYQMETRGAIALFGSSANSVDMDDLSIYEIISTQLAIVLQNADYNQVQNLHIISSDLLLKAWQSFLTVRTPHKVAELLCEHIKQISSIKQTLVWINESDDAHKATIFVSDKSEQVERAFAALMDGGHLYDRIGKIDQNPQIIFELGLSPSDVLIPLFRTMRAHQLIVVSLTDSTRLIGGVIVSVTNDQQLGLEDANLVKSLSYAAGQALERMMLIESMAEKSERLEAILRSITEGIFFVDENGLVAFCNPQVIELTQVSPSDILGQRPDVLLNLLAEKATDAEKTKLQFRNAVSSVQNFAGAERNYPIVELHLSNINQQVQVEFIAMAGILTSRQSWIGLVRTSVVVQSKWEVTSEAIDLLLHTLHATGAQLRSLIEHLAEGNNRYTVTEQKLLLEEIRKGATNFEQLLVQYSKFYNLNITEPALSYEIIDLNKLVQNTIQTRFESRDVTIHYDAPADPFFIETDRRFAEQGIFQQLSNAVKRTVNHNAITVRLQDHEHDVHISIESIDIHGQQSGELTPFDVMDITDPGTAWAQIYLYYALTHFNRCRIWAENRTDNVRAVIISFPKQQMALAPAEENKGTLSNALEVTNAGAPSRAPKAVMIISGKSILLRTLAEKLTQQHFELFKYQSAQDAVGDINLMRLDLIVIDGDLIDEDSIEVCKQIRRRTEVPIVFVATKATNFERIEALKAGADDYITEPISNEELIAKISVLFKRQNFADRTEQPLDLGDLHIDFARRTVYLNHVPVLLTRIEYDLLRTLALNMGQVLTHQQLLDKVWGPEYRAETQYLWVNVSRLRKKLEPTSYIHNQQGIGYIFQKT